MSQEPTTTRQDDATPGRASSFLLRGFVEQPVPLMPKAHAKQLRQRVAGRIDQLAAEAATRRARTATRWRLLGMGAGIAAAVATVITCVLMLVRSRTPDPVAAHVTALRGSVEIATGQATRSAGSLSLTPLTSQEQLRTGEQALAKASLSTGSTALVGPSSRVAFTPVDASHNHFDDTIVLDRGLIAVEVPPLPVGITLSVRTADVVVTVHGTRFSVERIVGINGEPGETRVAVTEGRVVVHRSDIEQVLTRGQSWSSRAESGPEGSPDAGAGDSTPPSPSVASTADDGRGGDEPIAMPHGSSRPLLRPMARPSLAAENELLENAMDARRRGNPKGAVDRLDRLLRQYPDSPLGEVARVERLRALEMLGDTTRTQAEARRYLKDYPHGFARKEVKSTARPGEPR